MLKLFAVTLLFATVAFLAMAAALARRSRSGKCQCKLGAQVMARAAAGRPRDGTLGPDLPLLPTGGCQDCDETCDAATRAARLDTGRRKSAEGV